MAEETVLDAVNAALESNGVSNAATETDDHSESTDVDAGDGASADTSVEGDAEGAETEESTEGDGDEPTGVGADGKPLERNADGTFKKAEPKSDDKQGDKPVEPKKPDAVNDPIPKDLKQETRERIQTLIKTAKESQAAVEKIQTDFNYMVNGIQATGATPAQYGETLSWLSLLNSGDPAQQTKALELIESVADRLATFLGKERTVSDPLKGHADLIDAVQKGQTTKALATEIARHRNSTGFRTELTATATREQQTQQQHQAAVQTARNELTALEQMLMKSDPQYEAKKAMLVPILQPILKNLPPTQWKAAFESAYAQAKVAAAPRAKASGIPKNQPLRAGSPAGGGARGAPKSMLDAVSDALGSMQK